MACRLFDAKPLSEPMMTRGQLNHKEHISINSKFITTQEVLFKKIHLNISSAKWWSFCLGLRELRTSTDIRVMLHITRPDRPAMHIGCVDVKAFVNQTITTTKARYSISDSKVYGANMGPIWGRQDPRGPHVGPMNSAIWDNAMLATLRPGSYIQKDLAGTKTRRSLALVGLRHLPLLTLSRSQIGFVSRVHHVSAFQKQTWLSTGMFFSSFLC